MTSVWVDLEKISSAYNIIYPFSDYGNYFLEYTFFLEYKCFINITSNIPRNAPRVSIITSLISPDLPGTKD